ncbi:hypothetical protein JTB14_035804 [Gonioctena quinquepunctata]|nr:hypothetical protein JTB14_035804 [Gonioctena quinquepunctata]
MENRRKPIDHEERILEPTKILGMFESQQFSYTKQDIVEGNRPFTIPNIEPGIEDGNYRFLMAYKKSQRSMDADSKPDRKIWLKYISETIKQTDKNTEVDLQGAITGEINVPQENINPTGKYFVDLSKPKIEGKTPGEWESLYNVIETGGTPTLETLINETNKMTAIPTAYHSTVSEEEMETFTYLWTKEELMISQDAPSKKNRR